MKLNYLLRVLLVSLFLVPGMTALAFAQEQHEDVKPSQDEARPRTQEEKPQKPDQNADKPSHNDRSKQNDNKTNSHAQSNDNAHAKQGGRIPEDKFRSHFGRQHTFVVNHPTIVSGQPRFQYGGYWFTIVDVWPAGWAYTDECYIDYINGEYFLFDLAHPGMQIALVVVM